MSFDVVSILAGLLILTGINLVCWASFAKRWSWREGVFMFVCCESAIMLAMGLLLGAALNE